MNHKSEEIILADAHVHFHDCFDIEKFFSSAWENFSTVSKQLGFRESFIAILFLTESQNANWFSHFHDIARGNNGGEGGVKSLKFKLTEEKNSLKVQIGSEKELILIGGRQIVSQENLEVLALGIREHFGEGNPIEEIIEGALSQGGIPVIPWGVGKWVGKRARIINNLIFNNQHFQFFVGDNGNRASFLPLSHIITEAEKKGIANVPGSDPLPFEGETDQPGSFGFFLDETLNADRPFEDIQTKLTKPSANIKTYGKLETPVRFLRNQIAMQLKKHIRN